ncbi:MAG: MFS transporter [Sphingopyxis sp.]
MPLFGQSSPTLPPAIPNARLAVLFMVMLVAAAGNTAMQSILPALGTKIGIADVWISLAFSWSALLWVLTAPKWARQSDQRGRKALMALGIIGFSASMLLCGLTLWAGLEGLIGAGLTFIIFALFRSLYGGFGSAAPPAVQAYVASRTEAAERTKALSLVSSSFGLGTVIGPTIAPWLILPGVGLAGPLLVFALIGVAVLIALRLMLPDDAPRFAVRGQVSAYPTAGGGAAMVGDAEGEDEEADDADSQSPERIGWTDKRILPWTIAGLVGGHAQAMLLGVIGFVILDRMGLRATPDLAAEPTGHVMLVGAVATLLAQWGLIPLLSLKPRTAVVVGSAMGGAGALLVGIGDSLSAISTGFAIALLGFGLFRPGFTAGASLNVPRRLQGQVAGQTASINGAAYIVAPAIGVLLYNWHAELSFILIGVIALSLSIWGWRGLRNDDGTRGVR